MINHLRFSKFRIQHSRVRAASASISMKRSALLPKESVAMETRCQHTAICKDADMANARVSERLGQALGGRMREFNNRREELLGTRCQQEDLPNAALLPQHMCFCCVTQWHPATNRQNELAIAHIISKLAHLGRIRLCGHPRNFHCRILLRRTVRQY